MSHLRAPTWLAETWRVGNIHRFGIRLVLHIKDKRNRHRNLEEEVHENVRLCLPRLLLCRLLALLPARSPRTSHLELEVAIEIFDLRHLGSTMFLPGALSPPTLWLPLCASNNPSLPLQSTTGGPPEPSAFGLAKVGLAWLIWPPLHLLLQPHFRFFPLNSSPLFSPPSKGRRDRLKNRLTEVGL